MVIQKDGTRSLVIFSLELVPNAPERPMRYMALGVGFYGLMPKWVQVYQTKLRETFQLLSIVMFIQEYDLSNLVFCETFVVISSNCVIDFFG